MWLASRLAANTDSKKNVWMHYDTVGASNLTIIFVPDAFK